MTDYSNGLFEWTSQWIDREHSRGLLVHCIEGKNRSASVLAAYIMWAEHWDAARAMRYLKSTRPWADPDIDALLNWEEYLGIMGRIGKRSALFPIMPEGSSLDVTGRTPLRGVEPDWPGMDEAITASQEALVAEISFAETAKAVGLDAFMDLHNASGSEDNCLIYALAGALGVLLTDDRVTEIGGMVRKDGIGVERGGFLNSRAVNKILDALGSKGTRVVLIDTTIRVASPEVGATATYNAEVVNHGGGRTIYLVNSRQIHFGWGSLKAHASPRIYNDEAGDGSRWMQFGP